MVSQEVRRAERIKSLLRAQIIFNNRMSTIDCVIKNISPLGAKIVLGDASLVPDMFELNVPRRGRTYRARMAWRDSEAVGVEFLEDAAETPLEPLPASDERVTELELQVADLKRRVRVLSQRLVDLGQDPNLAA